MYSGAELPVRNHELHYRPMPHETALIATIATGFGVALLLGLLAARLKLPPIVGYLVAGIIVGPFTPGFVADGAVASQAAELGVVLLMFGVGLHFSLRDLMAVRAVVLPGALLQIAVTGSVAMALGRLWGLSWGGALVLGVSLAVASTVVVLKGLEARDRLDSPEGRVAVGWLVVEDLAMVIVLVLLPAVAPLLGGVVPTGGGATTMDLGSSIALAIGKVVAFGTLMFAVGRRVVPWLLEHVARLGSRELFTLTVLSIALGVGTIASQLFGVSFALGAFFAGAVVSESELSHRAAADALPLQDAFAVLFFVSVGMLFDPRVIVAHPVQVLALLGVIVLGKLGVSYTILRLLGQSSRTALTLGGSLAQIGEFSFILTALGVALGLLSRDTQALVVAGALISITVNQPLSAWLRRMLLRPERESIPESAEGRPAGPVSGAISVGGQGAGRRLGDVPGAVDPFDFGALAGHVILVGYGRVGTTVTEALDRAGVPYVVVEEQERIVAGLRRRGERAVSGDATRQEVLNRAGIDGARLIVVTAPEPIRARRVVEVARGLNRGIAVAVRTHSATEQAFFEELLHAPGGIGRAVYAEREVALSLAHYTLLAIGRSDDEADFLIDSMRGRGTSPTETFAALHTRELEAILAVERRRPQSTTGSEVDGDTV
jgi:CPA2 family monovalent cation:H+ antiporter-2